MGALRSIAGEPAPRVRLAARPGFREEAIAEVITAAPASGRGAAAFGGVPTTMYGPETIASNGRIHAALLAATPGQALDRCRIKRESLDLPLR
jgi:hypothetical protein